MCKYATKFLLSNAEFCDTVPLCYTAERPRSTVAMLKGIRFRAPMDREIFLKKGIYGSVSLTNCKHRIKTRYFVLA